MYENIPSELRSLRQWLLWRYEWPNGPDEKPTKVPYQPNKRHANVNDSSSWSSFDECVSRLALDNSFSGLGFVFTSNDPYSGIDLDNATSDNPQINKQIEIFNKLNSYSEKSPSGLGVHIIVKGSVPTGVKTSLCEVYSSGRFFTFTGDVCNAVPIEDRQELLIQLWNEIRPVKQEVEVHDEPETISDREVLELARGAENGDKFAQLYDQELEGDQSAFDQALCNFLVFYSKNNAQIERLFRASVRGKRDKIIKRKDYLPRTIARARDKMQNTITPIDIEPLQEAIKQKLAGSSNGKSIMNEVSTTSPATTFEIERPPGLLGDLAEYIFYSAPRPVWEIAVAAAIGFMAGICGKAFNCNNDTLNLYVIVVADSGVGKEAPRTAISNLVRKIESELIHPPISTFLGPSEIASGAALKKYIKEHPSFCSLFGEIGLMLQNICDPRASASDKDLYKTLLNLFSVGTGRIGEHIYSNKDNSTGSIDGHAMSLFGDTTPETFYSMVDESMIRSGLLPRFIIMEYKGKRQYLNKNRMFDPSKELVQNFKNLMVIADGYNKRGIHVNVQLTPDAEQLLDKIDIELTDLMNDAGNQTIRELWNRTHLKIQRLSSLVAIGINWANPIIDIQCVNWAKNIVYHDTHTLLQKIDAGDIGKNNIETKQIKEIARIMIQCVKNSWDKNKKYFADLPQQMHADKIVPYVYINKRLSGLAIMNVNNTKASIHIKHALSAMLETGMIAEVHKDNMGKYGTNQRAFIIKDLSAFQF